MRSGRRSAFGDAEKHEAGIHPRLRTAASIDQARNSDLGRRIAYPIPVFLRAVTAPEPATAGHDGVHLIGDFLSKFLGSAFARDTTRIPWALVAQNAFD